MARAKKAKVTPDQLQLEVDRIKEEARQATVTALQRPPISRPIVDHEVFPPATPFARWLIDQAPLKRPGLIGMLAAAAKGDPRFPKAADPEEVRKHVSALGADGDIFEAIDDAEREWRCA